MTFTEAVAWQARYRQAAEHLLGIPVGQPVVVTPAQDEALCIEASRYNVADVAAPSWNVARS